MGGPALADMPAYQFEALDATGKAKTGLLDADNAKAARAQLRAQALVPLDVVAGRRRRPTTARACALRPARLLEHRTVGLDAPDGRPGRLRPAARTRADRAGRRGRGPAPARTGGAPAQRGQRRQPVRARAGQRAARVRRRLPRRRRGRRAERRARHRARKARRRPGGAPGAQGQADRRHAVPGDRLADRGGDRDLPRHLRGAAGGQRVRRQQARAAAADGGDARRSAPSCASGAGWCCWRRRSAARVFAYSLRNEAVRERFDALLADGCR